MRVPQVGTHCAQGGVESIRGQAEGIFLQSPAQVNVSHRHRHLATDAATHRPWFHRHTPLSPLAAAIASPTMSDPVVPRIRQQHRSPPEEEFGLPSSASSSPLSLSLTHSDSSTPASSICQTPLSVESSNPLSEVEHHSQVPKSRRSVRTTHRARSLVRVHRTGRLIVAGYLVYFLHLFPFHFSLIFLTCICGTQSAFFLLSIIFFFFFFSLITHIFFSHALHSIYNFYILWFSFMYLIGWREEEHRTFLHTLLVAL